eukprot:CAMPEP_0173188198 /NCGR_PEP_ID=MMETSP1141-20130122/11131_1 /TAXON_ID=483371 /ORGANISM="non described non described, Strain CCMP2298" /LENGTH=38 /DNA_ID= /DNA_START= /DNA_END= /DNA_ORIENTATION=
MARTSSPENTCVSSSRRKRMASLSMMKRTPSAILPLLC